MPGDLRWSWCNDSRNKIHSKCYVLKSSPNHPPTPTPSLWKNCLPWNWSLVVGDFTQLLWSMRKEQLWPLDGARNPLSLASWLAVCGLFWSSHHHLSLILISFISRKIQSCLKIKMNNLRKASRDKNLLQTPYLWLWKWLLLLSLWLTLFFASIAKENLACCGKHICVCRNYVLQQITKLQSTAIREMVSNS